MFFQLVHDGFLFLIIGFFLVLDIVFLTIVTALPSTRLQLQSIDLPLKLNVRVTLHIHNFEITHLLGCDAMINVCEYRNEFLAAQITIVGGINLIGLILRRIQVYLLLYSSVSQATGTYGCLLIWCTRALS